MDERKKLIDWLDRQIEAAKDNMIEAFGIEFYNYTYTDLSVHISSLDAIMVLARELGKDLNIEKISLDAEKRIVGFKYKSAEVFCLCNVSEARKEGLLNESN